MNAIRRELTLLAMGVGATCLGCSSECTKRTDYHVEVYVEDGTLPIGLTIDLNGTVMNPPGFEPGEAYLASGFGCGLFLSPSADQSWDDDAPAPGYSEARSVRCLGSKDEQLNLVVSAPGFVAIEETLPQQSCGEPPERFDRFALQPE